MAMSGYGLISVFAFSYTLCRLLFALVLIPPYLLKLSFQVLPTILSNAVCLLSAKGLERLVTDTDRYRAHAQHIAKQQLDGTFVFCDTDLHRGVNEWMDHLKWANDTEEFTVCGASVRFVHLKPSQNANSGSNSTAPRRPIVFLHGNPSWTYMWRNVITPLVDQGHEVYAIDWLGHGRSDKIAVPELCNFELHMRTLKNFFTYTKLKDAIVVAHDWGGTSCIALCTLPSLPHGTCTGLFLLDAFLPPRVSEMSLHCGLLYVIWFLVGGILGPYIPEPAVMYFMCPYIALSDAEAYAAPYRGAPISAKSSVFRFGHIVPGTPRTVLQSVRYTKVWKAIEGLCGPENFDILDAQSRLAFLDDKTREFWGRDENQRHLKMVVAFGSRDPLLIDYKDIISKTINARHMADWAVNGIWLAGGGHYPMEDMPEHISNLVLRLACF
ncbi:hypothetical protein N7451_007164 [Penicillium sp. IBT 35674x]|nr:hypothetical protein N7451_007164 [Penicillium sp. IBT 35674x]